MNSEILNTTTLESVSRTRRFLNIFIDVTFCGIIFKLIIDFADFNTTLEAYNEFLGFNILTLIFLIYYFLMELVFQKTVGKFVTKTMVVNKYGENPSFVQLLVRTFSRIIPLDQISYLFFKKGLHDYLSETRVIDAN